MTTDKLQHGDYVEGLTEEQARENLLDQIDLAHGLLRKLMSRDEIRLANKMVKEGKLYKGESDDKQKSVCFFKHQY